MCMVAFCLFFAFSVRCVLSFYFLFFFNDTATTEIYTLSLHDALPISRCPPEGPAPTRGTPPTRGPARSEEHTSELQSLAYLVCRLLLEKKKDQIKLVPHPGIKAIVNVPLHHTLVS